MIMTLAILQTIQLMDKPVCPFCVDALKACWNLILNQEDEKDKAFRSRSRMPVDVPEPPPYPDTTFKKKK